MMTIDVMSWWACLCAIGTLNVLAWVWSAAILRRRRSVMSGDVYRLRRWQLALSAVYVAGCAFRSAVPVFDVPRICLFDHWFSSVLVGRSVATAAELCFVGQWALMLHELSRTTQSRVGRWTALAVVPMIAVAETCSWYSVLTTSNLGHVAEESIWGFCVALLVVSAPTIAPRCPTRWRALLAGWCVAGMAYVAFMYAVDVPMYWARWVSDQAVGRHYMTLIQGLTDVASRRIVSHRWADWRHEIAWMSLYFSVAVWISISLIHVPQSEAHRAAEERRRGALAQRLRVASLAKH